jgi:hypothetical protein
MRQSLPLMHFYSGKLLQFYSGVDIINPGTSPNQLKTTQTPHSIAACLAYLNKIYRIHPMSNPMKLTGSKQLASDIDYRDHENIVRITCIAYIITLALSWRAFIRNSRIFEVSPVIEILGATPRGTDWALFALNIGFLIWLLLFTTHRMPAFGVLACAAFWVLQDLLRLQPYLYMYVATILLVTFFKPTALNALRIMIASVYFWAGFHKLNLTFYFDTFLWFVAPLYKFSEPVLWADFLMYPLVFTVPLVESTIGILLFFFPRQWRVATLMAFMMLMIVLACLGPTGHDWNRVVWVWNVYFFLLEFILFYNSSSASNRALFQFDAPALATITLFSIAPAFALIGRWPSYPAFKLYSGNIETATIIFATNENVTLLPKGFERLINRTNNTLKMDIWTANELEMLAYPATYVFRRGAAGLCRYLIDGQHAKLRVFDAPPFYSLDMTHHDYPLCPAKVDGSSITRSKAVPSKGSIRLEVTGFDP